MSNIIPGVFKLNEGYGSITNFTTREEFIDTIEKCVNEGHRFLDTKTNYGYLLSIFKTIPFDVAMVGVYNDASKAAEMWNKALLRSLMLFFQLSGFHEDIMSGKTTFEELNKIEGAKFILLAEEFIVEYRAELKDYLKMLCYSYGEIMAFWAIEKCIKDNDLKLPKKEQWLLKYNKFKWNTKNRVRFWLYRKHRESYIAYNRRRSPYYQKVLSIEQQLKERDKLLNGKILPQ